jgi:hypothetical protein
MTTKDKKDICSLLSANNIIEVQFIEWGDKPKLVILPDDGSDYDSTEEYIVKECKDIKEVNFKSVDLIKRIFPNIDKIFYYTSFHNAFAENSKEIVNDEQLYYIIKVDDDFDIEEYWNKDLGFCELMS